MACQADTDHMNSSDQLAHEEDDKVNSLGSNNPQIITYKANLLEGFLIT